MLESKQEIENLITFTDKHPKDLAKEDWLEDFNNFYDIVKDNFPYFHVKERMLGYNWLDLKDVYIERLEKANDVKDFLGVFFDALVALQDAHTSILLPQTFLSFFDEASWAYGYIQKFPALRKVFSEELRKANEYWLPIAQEFYSERTAANFDALILYSKGKYRIFDGFGSWKEKYGSGSVVKKVNGIAVDEAIKGTFEKDYLHWDVKRKKLYQLYIDPKMFGSEATFTIETTEGALTEVVFTSSKDYVYSSPLNYPSEFLSTKIWPEIKSAYIRFANFGEANYDEATIKYLKAFYTKVKDFEHLIIDIRGNGGGNHEVWVEHIVAPLTQKIVTAQMYAAYRKGEYVNLFRKDSGFTKEISKEELFNCPPEVLTDEYSVFDHSITVKPLGEISFNAAITLLADTQTFSAATTFTLFCKETSFAKVYGTPNKGEGVSTGGTFYVLPNSKILTKFFSGLGFDKDGNACEETKVQPDVFYEAEQQNHEELLDFVTRDLLKQH